jgi:TolB-like protein/Flp pilus assembly protein TadD
LTEVKYFMKKCPECGREYDNSMMFCLDDGTELLYGPGPNTEPQTAILHETAPPGEAATRAQIHTTEAERRVSLGDAAARPSRSAKMTAKPLVALAAAAVLLAAGFLGYRYFSSGPGSGSIDSIAVLPFQNVGEDPNFEYLSDGIAESLINSLTQLQQLKVIARNTAFRYKGKDVDAEQVGRDLNVKAVLTGRVRQVGDKLNIQVDLVDAVSGAQLWGEEYERPASDALSIKQAIAREVTEKLRLRMSGEQQQQLAARETNDPEAYQAYLRGRFYWNRRSAEGMRRAITEFQQAVDRDPNYALGYVGLADSYLLVEEYAGTPLIESMPKIESASARAIELDPALAEAHASRAMLYYFQWKWAEAEAEFKRAIQLNPKYATSRHWYSVYLRAMRRFDEGLQQMKLAHEQDPLSPNIAQNLAMMYMLTGDAETAISTFRKVTDLNPDFAPAYSNLGLLYVRQQRYAEAVASCRRAVEVSQRTSIHLSLLGYVLAVSGKREEAAEILKELEAKYSRGESIGHYLATVHAGLGDKDQAFAWLEKDFDKRSGLLSTITWRLYFDGLRSDPRYTDLVRRMNLAD